MSELSPKASALLQAARKAPRAPSREAVDRMERAVMVATGVTAAAAGAGAAKAASAWALSATGKSVLGAVALTVAGATVTVSLVVKSKEQVAATRQVNQRPARVSGSPAAAGDDAAAPVSAALPADDAAPPAIGTAPSVDAARAVSAPSSDDSAPTSVGEGPSAAAARSASVAAPPAPAPVSPPRARSMNGPAAVQPSAPVPAAQAPSTPSTKPERDTPPSPPPLVGLGSEVALLQNAKARLDAGDWAAAQALLDRHRAEFPNAALSIEADVLQVLAWCGDGRLTEASSLAARIRERAPRAPATARLAGSCVNP